MTCSKIYKLLALALAALLMASASAEGMIEWDADTPAPTEAVFDGMPTLPPVDALMTGEPDASQATLASEVTTRLCSTVMP